LSVNSSLPVIRSIISLVPSLKLYVTLRPSPVSLFTWLFLSPLCTRLSNAVYRDKTKQWIKLDGHVLTESPDGKKQSERIEIELRDGKTYYPDFSSGQGRITWPGGKSATIIDDGDDSLILEHEDGHREPLIMSDWSRNKMDELLHAYVMQNTLVVLPTAITEYRKNPAAPVLK